jgi:N12 class adenine-specific DNA methylase/predicted RNA methylase
VRARAAAREENVMPDAAQFTLNLFDSTAFGWTVDTPNSPTRPLPEPSAEPEPIPSAPVAARHTQAANFHLIGDRGLARGWHARTRDNIAAIRLSKELETTARTPTADEQARLLRFVGFGATELAQNCFPLPGKSDFRPGWETIGRDLVDAVTAPEYAALQRASQYAHFTPELIVRALWRAAEHLGFNGGRVLEPGMGTGLFFALLPPSLRDTCRLTGIEYDPITARIARLVHPEVRVRCEDYTRSRLRGEFDLAIGNPPFADRVVRADPTIAALGLRLHDYFIARSIARLRPGGIALFVTSTGTMDKTNRAAREHIASMADLIGAVRLPECSMRATAGTDVVIDVLVFQRRAEGQESGGQFWLDVNDVLLPEPRTNTPTDSRSDVDDDATELQSESNRSPAHGVVQVNEYFLAHPEMVLGEHNQRRGIYGPNVTYTCRPVPDAGSLEERLTEALAQLPAGIFVPLPVPLPDTDTDARDENVEHGTAAEGATIKEGSYFIGTAGRLMQIVNGQTAIVPIRHGKGGEGITTKAAKVIRALMPIRDAVRDVLRAQAADRPWSDAQIRLRTAYSTFIRYFGPINHTIITITTDPETSEERESHRRPHLAHFADDPDCWLVASIEDYDLDTGRARMGPIFRERVISPPATPLIASAADALAVTLNERGCVDPDHLAELLETDPETALAQLGTAVFCNPATEGWETADAYLSGAVRTKLARAEAAAAIDPQYQRNVIALRDVQPPDLPPSAITVRLGAPWIPTDVIETFAAEVMETGIRVWHTVAIASWSVDGFRFIGTAAGTSEWGTPRRHAGLLLHDALNGATPQIFDTVIEDGIERRILNAEATEAAKEKLARIKATFSDWIWTDPDRTDRLARIYNDRFNNLVPRHFDGGHLTLANASNVIRLREHQKRVIWRIIADGSTYIAHAVGAGKTFSIAAVIMEQKRLGLITKAMLVVPGHCLAQASRELLQLYPTARILVADETNFVKDKRARFLARAATANWDAIIITHSAFKFIAVPSAFEQRMIEEQIATYESISVRADDQDRTTRKRIEAMKERLAERLKSLAARHDDMVTIEEIGIDQLIVDEAQEFRKLSFGTNRTNLKGVDPDGSQRAWDLFLKYRLIDQKNPGRALIQSSGTPITNTLGEMYTLLRFQAHDLLVERGIHEFDAWASAFGETSTELELQPSGTYKPVERFSRFINVPELVDLFRSVADVAQKNDLRQYLKLPDIKGGQRQLVTAPASDIFRKYQVCLAERIEKIETRKRRPQKGDDILLAVITDGRHAAIDVRLVAPGAGNEPDNKLNKLITNVHRIWLDTGNDRFREPDATPYPIPGGAQLIFSDLGTLAAEDTRGFSVYRWIKSELVRLGVPAAQVAFIQDCKRSSDKQRLFNDVNAGRVRIVIGSTAKMGTGANMQMRLKAEHHLDVPWLPSDIEQREGRIERQGNQYQEIEIYAYATLGSMDATMWQANERKARFIGAALAGDRSIRTLEDIGSQANQFALAKAIASGDPRLMQKAGLEAEIARLERQRAAHFDDQHNIRRQIAQAQAEQQRAKARVAAIAEDLARRLPTRGDSFAIELDGRTITERRIAGELLISNVRLARRAPPAGSQPLGRIGGFQLASSTVRSLAGQIEATLVLRRTAYDQDIVVDDDLTALGLIARLEHVLDRFEAEQEGQRRLARDAATRLAGYAARIMASFPLQDELDARQRELNAIEADLAQSTKADKTARSGKDRPLAA